MALSQLEKTELFPSCSCDVDHRKMTEKLHSTLSFLPPHLGGVKGGKWVGEERPKYYERKDVGLDTESEQHL